MAVSKFGLVQLGIPVPIANEIAAQANGATKSVFRLQQLGVATRLARELVTQMTAGAYNVDRLSQSGMVPAVGAYLKAGGTPTPTWVSSPANRKVLGYGDSRETFDKDVTALVIKERHYGPRNWAALFTGQRFIRDQQQTGDSGATIKQILNGGGPGPVTQSMEATFISNDHATVRLIWGINSWTAGVTLADAQADTLTAIQLCFNYQKRLVIGEFPADMTGSGVTNASLLLASQYDDWLSTLNAQYPWVFHANSFRAMAVNSTGTTEAKPNTLQDGKHLLGYGGYLAGKAEAPVYAAIFPDATPIISFDPTVNNLVTNGALAGTAGSAPTSWTDTPGAGLTHTWTYDTDGTPILRVTGTPTGTAGTQVTGILLNQGVSSAFAAGTQLRAGFGTIAMDAGSTGVTAIAERLALQDGGGIQEYNDLDTGGPVLNGKNNIYQTDTVFSGPILAPRTPALNIGTSYTSRSTRLLGYFIAGVAVDATFRIKQGIVKIATQ